MKNLFKISLVLYSVTILSLQSCSSPSSPTPDAITANGQISVDGQTYTLLPQNAVIELRSDNMNIDNQVYDRSSITINAMTGFTIATVSFDLFYKDGLPVAGTYTIDQSIDNTTNFNDNLIVAQKLCLGWTSSCSVAQAGNSSFSVQANNPTGTVNVINNGNNNYTIQYNGNYKKYDSNFEIVGQVPVIVNITSNIVTY